MQIEEPIPVGSEAPVRWNEAVAIVRSVADAVEGGRIRGVPGRGGLAVDGEGAVHLLPGAPARPAAGGDLRVVTDLRSLLAQLLDAEAPPALRALAEGSNGTAMPTSLQEFMAALAFFERPSKGKDLAALAFRLRQRQEERRLEAEMERLTHKARTEEHLAAAAGLATAGAPQRSKWGPRVMFALVAVLTVAVTAVLIALVSSMDAAPASSTSGSESKQSGVVATLRAVADAAFGKSSTPVTPAAVEQSASAPKGARKAQRSPAGASAVITASSPRRERRPTVEIFREPVPETIEVPLSPDTAVALVPALRADPTAIYDRRSLDVIQPELLRPHLPNVSSFAGGKTGQLEVLIAEDGRVERVRLLATTIERRYYDGMLLSAVKAWVFRPASRGGQPVKYRIQIPLT